MAKQTFTTGQVLTAAQMTSLQQTAMLGGAANAKTASYVLVAADAGDAITMSNAGATTITVNTGLFAAGDTVTIINLGAGACTITAGTATVTTSGSLVLAQNQGGVLRFTSASAAIFFQFVAPAAAATSGLNLITTQSFSASSSVLVNDVFSSTYTNYRILVNYSGSASAATRLRFRVGGSSDSNNSYSGNSIFVNNTTIVNEQNGVETSYVFNFGNFTGTPTSLVNIEVGSPNESKKTAMYSTGKMAKSGASDAAPMLTAATFDATTVFTGFELFPASGNITGSVQVYGYGK